MTWMSVWLHRWCIILLAHYHTVGLQLVRTAPNTSDADRFYAWNFWWARASYLRALDPARILRPKNRYSAEGWVGAPLQTPSRLEPALGRYACLLQPYTINLEPFRYLNPKVYNAMAAIVWEHRPGETPRALAPRCVVNCLNFTCGPRVLEPIPGLWVPGTLEPV